MDEEVEIDISSARVNLGLSHLQELKKHVRVDPSRFRNGCPLLEKRFSRLDCQDRALEDYDRQRFRDPQEDVGG
jgi:hypothetical protein